MTIVFEKTPFFYHLFGLESHASDDLITRVLTSAFEQLGTTIEVAVEEQVVVTVTSDHLTRERAVERVGDLASQGKYDRALAVITEELEKQPTLSELYRMRGQIFSEQGDQQQGIDSLIDALRFDPRNKWALIMMGNIYAREKADIETGMIYYEKALEVDLTDNIAMNNIGAMLLESGNEEQGFEYFQKALDADPTYVNTYLGFSLAHQRKQDYRASFDWAIKGLKQSKHNDQVTQILMKQATQTAQVLVGENNGIRIAEGFIAKLETESSKAIKVESTQDIPFTAKLEIAENYGREYHFVRYKPNTPAVAHLLVHELMHLQLVIEARAHNANELFISKNSHRLSFKSRLGKYIKKLKKLGVTKDRSDSLIEDLFNGLNSQIYNTPIDQFIERRIYTEFPQLRPHQFLSLLSITKEGVDAVTRKEIVEMSDPWILEKSKLYNIINVLGLKDLYGVDLVPNLKATSAQKTLAQKLFGEYKDYLVDTSPGEEYDLVDNWAEDLGLTAYYELVDEAEYRKNEADPIHLPQPDLVTTSGVAESVQKEDMDTFQQAHAGKDINMAVVMFMVSAIKRYKAMPVSKVKEIAFQIAQIGMNGISPEKDGYHIPLIPDSNYSGYQMLANYYVSWAIAVPDLLSQIQIPFDKEYETALQLVR